jgi:hypothetical protein
VIQIDFWLKIFQSMIEQTPDLGAVKLSRLASEKSDISNSQMAVLANPFWLSFSHPLTNAEILDFAALRSRPVWRNQG